MQCACNIDIRSNSVRMIDWCPFRRRVESMLKVVMKMASSKSYLKLSIEGEGNCSKALQKT